MNRHLLAIFVLGTGLEAALRQQGPLAWTQRIARMLAYPPIFLIVQIDLNI